MWRPLQRPRGWPWSGTTSGMAARRNLLSTSHHKNTKILAFQHKKSANSDAWRAKHNHNTVNSCNSTHAEHKTLQNRRISEHPARENIGSSTRAEHKNFGNMAFHNIQCTKTLKIQAFLKVYNITGSSSISRCAEHNSTVHSRISTHARQRLLIARLVAIFNLSQDVSWTLSPPQNDVYSKMRLHTSGSCGHCIETLHQ